MSKLTFKPKQPGCKVHTLNWLDWSARLEAIARMAEEQDLVGECVCKEAMLLELRLLLCLAGAKESSSLWALLYLFFNSPDFVQVLCSWDIEMWRTGSFIYRTNFFSDLSNYLKMCRQRCDGTHNGTMWPVSAWPLLPVPAPVLHNWASTLRN